MNELKIVATIVLNAEYQEEVLQALYKVVDATRKEEGNISYDLHQDLENKLSYTVLEVWKSNEAITIHNESTHFNEFKKAIEGKIEGLQIAIIKKIY